MIKRLLTVLAVFFTPLTAYAAEAMPEKGAARIPWAIKCAGAMPERLWVPLAIIGVLTVVSVIYYRKAGGGHE